MHYPKAFAEFLVHEVFKKLNRHFEFLLTGKSTAAELHATNITSQSGLWSSMRSNATCLICTKCKPNHPLSCGHSLCDDCLTSFGTLRKGQEYGYDISWCILCNRQCTLSTKIKPPTCGVRTITIDGGGTRAVIPLEFLHGLQKVLGQDCFLPDFFDIAIGTSSGTSTTCMLRT